MIMQSFTQWQLADVVEISQQEDFLKGRIWHEGREVIVKDGKPVAFRYAVNGNRRESWCPHRGAWEPCSAECGQAMSTLPFEFAGWESWGEGSLELWFAARDQKQVEYRLLDDSAVIVTRHIGAVTWLAGQRITGRVIAQATPEDARGRVVIGNLPLHLAAIAAKVGSIDMPNLAAADRGRDLTPEEMDAAGATIQWYVVRTMEEIECRICEALESARVAEQGAVDAEELEDGAWCTENAGRYRGIAEALKNI